MLRDGSCWPASSRSAYSRESRAPANPGVSIDLANTRPQPAQEVEAAGVPRLLTRPPRGRRGQGLRADLSYCSDTDGSRRAPVGIVAGEDLASVGGREIQWHRYPP